MYNLEQANKKERKKEEKEIQRYAITQIQSMCQYTQYTNFQEGKGKDSSHSTVQQSAYGIE